MKPLLKAGKRVTDAKGGISGGKTYNRWLRRENMSLVANGKRNRFFLGKGGKTRNR